MWKRFLPPRAIPYKNKVINLYKDLLKTQRDIKNKDLLSTLSEKVELELKQSKTILENTSILAKYLHK